MLDQITTTESYLDSNDALIIYAEEQIDFNLIYLIMKTYPKRMVYWIFKIETIRFQQILQTYQKCNLDSFLPNNLAQLLNHRGPSFLTINFKTQLWIFPENYTQFQEHFSSEKYCSLSKNLTPYHPNHKLIKPWFQFPKNNTIPKHISIIGAGIAGAMTARLLAENGIQVTLIEQYLPAQAASGNKQGLLYAKISPHNTIQSQLLLGAYGLSLSYLQYIQTNQSTWKNCGVLHLDYSRDETLRNLKLAEEKSTLYHYLDQETACKYAGIHLPSGGLFWPYGAWLNPASWIHSLLQHDNIHLKTQTTVQDFQYIDSQWYLQLDSQNSIVADALILCQGADSAQFSEKLGLQFTQIRGQTSVSAASAYSRQLKCALSGKSYISPIWQENHCFGASFHPNNANHLCSKQDDDENWDNLYSLNPELYHSLIHNKEDTPQGHCAIRCDSYDHLPIVGQIGDHGKMRTIYAKLALDKNYRLSDPCPFLPNLYINTAHGSRGLLTAPICSQSLVADILQQPQPLAQNIREALSPNRIIIRNIVQKTKK